MSDFWDGISRFFGGSDNKKDENGRTHTDGKVFYDTFPANQPPDQNAGRQLPVSGPDGIPSQEYYDELARRQRIAAADENFDAVDEAKKLITLAKERMDAADTFWSGNNTEEGRAAAEKLANEWASLSQNQRNLVGDILPKYNNSKMDALPEPIVHKDAQGNVDKLEFETAFWDWNRGPSTILLESQNGVVIEERGIWARYRGTIYETEYTTKDLYEK